MPEYFDLFAKRGVENFSNNYPTETPDTMNYVLDNDSILLKNYEDDKVGKDRKVIDPHGYGYVPPLPEARNQDALSIQHQESTIFALGAVAGVSLIVFSLLISSSS
jgi:hypothetical protein